MKRLLLGLLGMLVFTSLGASIKWDWDFSTESYDFEKHPLEHLKNDEITEK